MNIEITDLDNILNYLETTSLEPHDDYSSEFTYKEQKILYKYIKQLQQENNDKVVDKVNWNKLKDYIRETKLKEFEKSYGKRFGKTFTQAEVIVCNMILDKMQELEQGSNSNE